MNEKMTPSYFLEIFVLENLFDFKEDPGSVRKGINAALSAFHMADNYFHYAEKNNPDLISIFRNRRDFIIHLGRDCHLFNDIQSIANAYKHLYTNTSQSHVSVGSGGAVFSISIDNTTLEMDYSPAHSSEIVVYRTKDNIEKPLLKAVESVTAYWTDLIRECPENI